MDVSTVIFTWTEAFTAALCRPSNNYCMVKLISTTIISVTIKTLIKNKKWHKVWPKPSPTELQWYALNPPIRFQKRRPLGPVCFFIRKTVLFTLIKWSISSWLVLWEIRRKTTRNVTAHTVAPCHKSVLF